MFRSITIGDRVLLLKEGYSCGGVVIGIEYNPPGVRVVAYKVRLDQGEIVNASDKLVSPEPLHMNPAYQEGYAQGREDVKREVEHEYYAQD